MTEQVVNPVELVAKIEAANKELLESAYYRSRDLVEKGSTDDLRSRLEGLTWAELDAAVIFAKALVNSARELTLRGDFDILESLAKQVWDECRHARYAVNLLKGLGGELHGYRPFPGMVPIYEHIERSAEKGDLLSMHAEAQLTGEAGTLAGFRGFMDGCQSTGKYPELLRVSKIVERDEIFHVNNGRRVLKRYAVTDELAKKAWDAAKYHREAKLSSFRVGTMGR